VKPAMMPGMMSKLVQEGTNRDRLPMLKPFI
jgi:hypothetical protein